MRCADIRGYTRYSIEINYEHWVMYTADMQITRFYINGKRCNIIFQTEIWCGYFITVYCWEIFRLHEVSLFTALSREGDSQDKTWRYKRGFLEMLGAVKIPYNTTQGSQNTKNPCDICSTRSAEHIYKLNSTGLTGSHLIQGGFLPEVAVLVI